jgi:hypothetical protein
LIERNPVLFGPVLRGRLNSGRRDEKGKFFHPWKWVGRTVAAEGFQLNRNKTRVMRRGAAQNVCGVTVNETLGLSRKERRRLRAMIHKEKQRAAAGKQDLVAINHINGWLAYLSMLNGAQTAALLKRRWEK